MDDMQMPQDSSSDSSTIDMIKQALMKVIDDMTAMESDRHLPDGHPMKKVAMVVKDDSMAPSDSDMDGTSMGDPAADEDSDPAMLDSLMGEASKADADGSMPEDKMSDLPPEVMDAVNKKKASMGK